MTYAIRQENGHTLIGVGPMPAGDALRCAATMLTRFLFALLLSVLCSPLPGIAADKGKTTTPTFDFSAYTSKVPNAKFHLNTQWTTPYGPAWADVTMQQSNFLECTGAAIALCYYSGPNGTLPCTDTGKGAAECTCYVIPAGNKYKVLMTAILNLDVYNATLKECGPEGADCQPTGKKPAAVCGAITNDPKHNLIPGAQVISAFSTYLAKSMPVTPANCPAPGAYAGCMTAPCTLSGKTDPTTGLALAQCLCPIWNGPYQIGGKKNVDQCNLPQPNVWSAAYNPALDKK